MKFDNNDPRTWASIRWQFEELDNSASNAFDNFFKMTKSPDRDVHAWDDDWMDDDKILCGHVPGEGHVRRPGQSRRCGYFKLWIVADMMAWHWFITVLGVSNSIIARGVSVTTSDAAIAATNALRMIMADDLGRLYMVGSEIPATK